MSLLGIPIPKQDQQLACGELRAGVRTLRPPGEAPLREALCTAPKRQNTSHAASPAGQVTIIDPTHPLYGRTLPLLRVHSTQSKARLVVQLPDGRVQWLPRAVTDLAASAAAAPPHTLIAVPTLLPLAQLVCAMLTGKEDMHHETVHALTVPLGESPSASTIVEPSRHTCSAATGPMPLRPDSADAGCLGCCRQGEQP
jgi:hypothetical protein